MTAKYVNGNIFQELGLGQLPDERKSELLEQMNELVHKRLMLRIISQLPEAVAQELEGVDDMSNEERLNVLVQYVPNLSDMILTEIEQVKAEMQTVSLVEDK